MLHSQNSRPNEQHSVRLQVEATQDQSTTSYQEFIPRKKCILPKAVYGVASIMLLLVTAWVVVSRALDAEAAAKASKASSHYPERIAIRTMPTEAAAPRKNALRSIRSLRLRTLLATALRESHVSSAVLHVPSEVAFVSGPGLLPGLSLARPQRQASTPVMLHGGDSDGTGTLAKLGNRVDRTLVKGINSLDKLGKQIRQSVDELRDNIEADRLSGASTLDKLGPLAVRDRQGHLDVNPLLDPYGKLRGRGFVDDYTDRLQQQRDEKRRKRDAGTKALDKLGAFAVRDRDGKLDVNPLLDPYGKLRGRGLVDNYADRVQQELDESRRKQDAEAKALDKLGPLAVRDRNGNMDVNPLLDPYGKLRGRGFIDTYKDRFEDQPGSRLTDQDGKTTQKEFKWSGVVADQLYLQCSSVLDQDEFRPADIDRMLSGLSRDAIASNSEARRALNQLAGLSIRLTEIEQSSSPDSAMLDEASDIRNEIRSWARSLLYLRSLPAERRGALPSSWPTKI